MADWKNYVFSVVVVSVSCGIVMQIIADTGKKELVRLICGVMISGVILRPMMNTRARNMLKWQNFDDNSTAQHIDAGELAAENMRRQYITEACEAYVLNKAESLGGEITPTILLDEACMPAYAEIQGDVEAGIQEELECILYLDLGIPKENQQWSGNLASSG